MSFLNWGFRANVQVHNGVSAELPLKSGSSGKFSSFVDSLNFPSKLWLNPLLFNGVLQTLYYTSAGSKVKVFYGRELFTYADEGICSLDWVIPAEPKDEFNDKYKATLPEGSPRLHPNTRFFSDKELLQRKEALAKSTAPIVVILHGLAGGSHEPLIRHLTSIINPDWDTVVLNNRGCCRTKITTGSLYTALATGDIGEVLTDLHEKYPERPIYAVGFSFGAIMLANYLGEGTDIVKAACVVGCGWDLVDSSYHMDSSWSGRYMFGPALTSFLNKLVQNNFGELSSHNPEVFNKEQLAEGKGLKKTWQFDQLFTRKLVGFDSAFEYYREASPARNLPKIRTPTLALNSTDDPCVSVRLPVLEAKANPYVSLVETDLGGHLAWAQSGGRFWGAEMVQKYFEGFENTFA
ncbi:alcohol acyl transferase [Suhomyces tanzawaensis NRRL Y-17324]|uniref:Alcohol acyl transferase n=1 Tax=Suhomyces tanzawaensis NRRL Y-17324 TaxID=984487 RepID=A0A1E4SLQ8_9ASCO|nr:alcohol acyl transferase [Suhomyces tanzawaensis NRRL Y-17324]ODV80337.1 alcohol acyl transferase [Suhomyces tanzawaensis NRRL Y-17324]